MPRDSQHEDFDGLPPTPMDASIQKVDLGEILTAEELADRLRLSPSTVYRMARRGDLPRLRGLGRALRFAWAEVCRALQEADK